MVGVIRIYAAYSDGMVEKSIIGRLTGTGGATTETDDPSHDSWISRWSQKVIHLHHEFLLNGDREDYRQRYGWEPIGWYMASCELLLLHINPDSLAFIQVGTISVYLQEGNLIHPVVPLHNVRYEIEAHTIEQSCVSPFASRSTIEIAAQLLAGSPRLAAQLAAMPRNRFETQIGHVTSRLIGYFPSPLNLEPGFYRQETPMVANGVRAIKPEVGSLFLVCTTESEASKLAYHEESDFTKQFAALTANLQSHAKEESEKQLPIIEMKQGTFVTLEVLPNGQFGRLATHQL